MAAYYDTYDYPSYWQGRDYEHESEVLAIKSYLQKIPKIDKILDIGCGYGRLAPVYVFRAKKIVLADPSKKLLSEAKKRISSIKQILPRKLNHISFTQASVQNLSRSFKPKQFDLVLMVRVMHHLTDPAKTIEELAKTIKPGGYLILEFANKIHYKATFQQFCHGDFTFPIDITPADRTSPKNRDCIAFYNYHPDVIRDLLIKNGLKVKDIRSVSNIRSVSLKKHMPVWLLVEIEKYLQKPLAKLFFGPSIFILARKKA